MADVLCEKLYNVLEISYNNQSIPSIPLIVSDGEVRSSQRQVHGVLSAVQRRCCAQGNHQQLTVESIVMHILDP